MIFLTGKLVILLFLLLWKNHSDFVVLTALGESLNVQVLEYIWCMEICCLGNRGMIDATAF